MIAVFLKEVLDNFRDRRVIINTLILSPLLGPVIFAIVISFMASQETERMEAPLELPVVGAEHAPNLIGFLERQGVIIEQPPADPEQAVRSEEEEVVLRIPQDFAEYWIAALHRDHDRTREQLFERLQRADRFVEAATSRCRPQHYPSDCQPSGRSVYTDLQRRADPGHAAVFHFDHSIHGLDAYGD